jgi:hypothetical protein
MLASARAQFDGALAVYESADRNSPIFLALPETGVACNGFISLILQWQGYSHEALRRGSRALAAAHDLGHTFYLEPCSIFELLASSDSP